MKFRPGPSLQQRFSNSPISGSCRTCPGLAPRSRRSANTPWNRFLGGRRLCSGRDSDRGSGRPYTCSWRRLLADGPPGSLDHCQLGQPQGRAGFTKGAERGRTVPQRILAPRRLHCGGEHGEGEEAE